MDADDLAELAQLILNAAREIRFRSHVNPKAIMLNPSEAKVMTCIDAQPGITPSSVAESTGLQRSNLSTALRGLEERGFVERRVDPRDRRAVNLFPTALSVENLRLLQQEWAQTLAIGLGDDDSDVEAAKRLLARVDAGLAAARRR